jgi:tripartite-type tricarboxylate transporter receptor subunit TctC
MRHPSIGLAIGIAFACSAPAFSQTTYPAKPIRLVVPFVPGGSTDLIARIMGQNLQEALGQQVVVESRAGAGGQTRAVNRVPACGM